MANTIKWVLSKQAQAEFSVDGWPEKKFVVPEIRYAVMDACAYLARILHGECMQNVR